MNLVGSVLFGGDDAVVQFVETRNRDLHVSDKRVGLGVIRNNKLVAGIVFQNQRDDVDIEVLFAADDPSWAMPATLRTLFFYPFVTLGLTRMTAIIGRKNKRSRRFVAGDGVRPGMGFKLEGCARRALNGRQDAMIYGLLRTECRFLRLPDGQEKPATAARGS